VIWKNLKTEYCYAGNVVGSSGLISKHEIEAGHKAKVAPVRKKTMMQGT
jgi:hypothetical protein